MERNLYIAEKLRDVAEKIRDIPSILQYISTALCGNAGYNLINFKFDVITNTVTKTVTTIL